MQLKSLQCYLLLTTVMLNSYISCTFALSLDGILGSGRSKKTKHSVPRLQPAAIDGVECTYRPPELEHSYLPPELLIENEEDGCPPSLGAPCAPKETSFVPGYYNTLGPIALQAANDGLSPVEEEVKEKGEAPKSKSIRGIVFGSTRLQKNTTIIGGTQIRRGLVEAEGAILSSAGRISKAISTFFAIDKDTIKSNGLGFMLSYSILSTINGAITLSCAWYLSCKKTGLSPLFPGQWKSLAAAYGTIYVFIQVFKPFRLAGAIAMSKSCRNLLQQTQQKFDCSCGVAAALQYSLAWILWAALASMGIGLASVASGVPVFG